MLMTYYSPLAALLLFAASPLLALLSWPALSSRTCLPSKMSVPFTLRILLLIWPSFWLSVHKYLLLGFTVLTLPPSVCSRVELACPLLGRRYSGVPPFTLQFVSAALIHTLRLPWHVPLSAVWRDYGMWRPIHYDDDVTTTIDTTTTTSTAKHPWPHPPQPFMAIATAMQPRRPQLPRSDHDHDRDGAFTNPCMGSGCR